jgi:hypothetical protein
MAGSPFFRVIRFTVETGRLVASRDVLLSGEAQWNLKWSNIIRSGVLFPWRYVATVYAIKLGNNIILATRALHSFVPFLSLHFTLYAIRSQLFVIPSATSFSFADKRLNADCSPPVDFELFHHGILLLASDRSLEAHSQSFLV